ncbi:MAG: triphosphoribosyl-dephospho-CoA synthase CitG [Bacillota bacterium]|nr:triphosphoribosyl-dephospho-CoA synthase CitG [Bacillota bacterium]
MENFFLQIDKLAQKALLYEVLLSPKPGLVDTINTGSHKDMDLFTFVDSIVSLDMFFYKWTQIGFESTSKTYENIFPDLRASGLQAEKAMYTATAGVNTHKGAIFIFALLCGAIGSLKKENKILTVDNICNRAGEISKNILKDFEILDQDNSLTYGCRQYLDHGLLGARGEAYLGFPSIKKAYKVIEESVDKGLDEKLALGNGLIELMTFVLDSNIIGRKGREAADFVKERAQEIKALAAYASDQGLKKIYETDRVFIEMNISPGGCADLAAASLFIFWVTRLNLL